MPSGFDLLFPVVFAVVALAVLAGIAFTVYRLIRDRRKIAAYQAAMLELTGEVLKATRDGDLAKAQLLQSQLLLMQQQLLSRRQQPGNATLLNQQMMNGVVPGDVNGDGIPGN
ncbi:hypothetical protein [Gryllotalpicola koreensis]|uniref:hypothetical protein n=1 Tax=Gryllotalpicola koreensis TaxID=993086 RepID=UPI0031CE1501